MTLPFDEVSAHKQLDDIDTSATEAREAMAQQDAGLRNQTPGEDQSDQRLSAEERREELEREAPERLRKVQDEVVAESRPGDEAEPRRG